jgi:hypothetical protein
MIEWTKHDDKLLDYIVSGEENKLRSKSMHVSK